MFSAKAKELARQLEQREQEIALLTARVGELTEKAKQYDAQRGAIAQALTEAQAAAQRVLARAEDRAEEMLRAAQTQCDEKLMEADRIRSGADSAAQEVRAQAEEDAAATRAKAQADARNIRLQAEARAEECEQYVLTLKGQMRTAAEDARKQAEAFNSFLSQIQAPQIDERIQEEPVPQSDLPDDYDSPAALMRSIYQLQGRAAPAEGAADETAEPTPEESPEPAGPAPEEAEARDESDAAPAEPEEEHIFTVDEIMSGQPRPASDKSQFGNAPDLDALIDDVLKF